MSHILPFVFQFQNHPFTVELPRGVNLPMAVGKGDRTVPLGGNTLKYRLRLGLRLTDNNRHVWLYDASLLAGNLLKRIAQKLRVVETYVGDNAQQRSDDICRVEPAAHTDLYNSYIHLLVTEIVERQSNGHLEERQLLPFKEFTILIYKLDHLFLRYHLTVDANAFAKVDKMRRCIESHLVACLLQNRGKEMRHRAFAVGTGHVDGAEAVFRMFQILHHRLRVAEVGFICSGTYAVICRQRVEKIIESFFVRHYSFYWLGIV